MKYAIYSMIIVVAMIIIFYMRFEKRSSRSRRLVIIAVMTALSVLGRFIFAAIPAFKPIAAIVIISAIWLGPECGFMVGSLSVLISNFYFGQGPWTPFQMIGFGLIGILAAWLSKPLKKSNIALSIYGAFAGFAYSCIMDVWTVVWYSSELTFELLTAAIVTALPFAVVYAISNIIFLLVLGKPFGEKLERVINKYGI